MIIIIVILSLSLRVFGIYWDGGYALHPDERMLFMVVERLQLFENLNPEFFNYGSLPIYLLKILNTLTSPFFPSISEYDQLLYVGRAFSALTDTGTVLLIYIIVRHLYNQKRIALYASTAYALAFFPIQNAHFFIVDVFLTFFVTALLLVLLIYLKKPRILLIPLLGIIMAAAITSKITAVIFIFPVSALFFFPSLKKRTKRMLFISLGHTILFGFFTVCFSYIFMPFAFNNALTLQELFQTPSAISLFNPQFISELRLQLYMNSNPYIFPYTLQYVDTPAYWYYIRNIVLFGLGPPLSLFAIIGILGIIIVPYKKNHPYHPLYSLISDQKRFLRLIISGVALFYFIIVGRSAVKFMRYLLPIYPVLSLWAGGGIFILLKRFTSTSKSRAIVSTCILLTVYLWTGMFMRIYTKPNTRLQASAWIYEHIPAGSTIAVEHWDDALPLPIPNAPSYTIRSLPLYDIETPEKWELIDTILDESHYIIIASNRLYTPLMRLTDCTKHPKLRCFPETAQYYRHLFSDTSAFRKIAEFSSFPGFSIGSYSLNIPDTGADESFTVYDHPTIMIFKKNKQ